MNAVEKYLIRHDDKIAPLLTPPFDRTSHDPGYIKGYPPGIRENGGQYTHGAIWSIFAFAALGQGNRAGDLFAMLNPISHSSTPSAVARYKVEPYVACADVYSVAPHVGRGGWTWYTGSAGWLYRAGLEAILGFRVHGTVLAIDPCLPKAWPGYEIVFHRRGSREHGHALRNRGRESAPRKSRRSPCRTRRRGDCEGCCADSACRRWQDTSLARGAWLIRRIAAARATAIGDVVEAML